MKPDYINQNIRRVSEVDLKKILHDKAEERKQKERQAALDAWPATMGDLRLLEERITLLMQEMRQRLP